MPASYKTPGVYLVEKDAFPGSVVEVATAIPAFIGYTEKAEYNGKDLTNKPFRITSFAEYLNIFGGAPSIRFTYGKAADAAPAENAEEDVSSLRFHAHLLPERWGRLLYLLSWRLQQGN